MFNLFKYELKKSLALKLVILSITAVVEIFFLIGLYAERDFLYSTTVFLLCVAAVVGPIVIGLHSIHLLRNDLNTTKGYMLFMTPNSSFKILGAKVIENGVSIIIAGAFYTVLGFIDITLTLAKYSSLNEIVEFFSSLLDAYNLDIINARVIISLNTSMIAHWLYIVAVAFFAVVLSATFFNGRKWNAFASFGIFLAILIAVNNIMGLILIPSVYSIVDSFFYMQTAIYLVLSVVMYFVTAWIMDNKLSV